MLKLLNAMRKLQGVVVSAQMTKGVVVRVDRLKKHPKYLKYYRVSKKFKAHDEKSEYRAGDSVVIEETRPLSKEKRWKVAALVKRLPTEENGDEISNS
ncbi:MAG: 30S ribosomal protein S17 [Candidatus Sungbacteria bacterium]|nr:30S ribosomal protein S17 [Candidatus Sungbacteria bacterium]